MIVDIQKGGFIRGLIEYHEKKVTAGKADRIFDNTLSENIRDRVQTYLETAELNPRVKRNKFLHISVSFNLEDRGVDPEKMLKIADEYLKEMQITDTPVLIYEHSDKRHRHFHIVTTTIDYSGKKIPDFKDHYRSQQLSRKLEKEFGLIQTQYENKGQIHLQEINATKYKILNSLHRLATNKNALAEMERVLTREDLDDIKANTRSDYEIQKLISERGKPKDDFHLIFRILTKHDLVEQSQKQQLMNRLNQLKLLSKDREDFLSRVESAGLYVRKIANRVGGYSLTYGLGQHGFYVKEKDLPASLRYEYLFTGKKMEMSFDREQQKKYLRNVVMRALRSAGSLPEFEKELQRNNIQYDYATNARGVYGISFVSSNVKEAARFKGSELDKALTWNAIEKTFGHGKAETIQATRPEVSPNREPNFNQALQGLGHSFDNQEDEDQKKKRKKNDQDQDLERD